MEKAKQAVSDFMHKAGSHDTTVKEKVNPAITHENVTPTRHENVQTAVDKEIHQDHFHTSVQPVHDREVLPEEHTHNVVPVEHRSFEHGDSREVESRLAHESSQFRDERTVGDTKHTHSVDPAAVGEHVHHHVHETIQPVVQKETIQPSVVHTTVPVHEVHHNAAQHHSTSALPPVSMTDFKSQGGVLSGREERFDGFAGEPRSVGGALGSADTSTGGTAATGVSNAGNTTTSHTGTGTDSLGTDRNTGTTGTQKASLMDKINPKVDSDGDGKAGFMK